MQKLQHDAKAFKYKHNKIKKKKTLQEIKIIIKVN